MLALLAVLPLLASAAPTPNEPGAPSPNPIALPVQANGLFNLWGSENAYLAAKYGNSEPTLVRRGMVERTLVERQAQGTADLTNFGSSYSVPIEIGTPPQKFESMIDTGSSVMWVVAKCNSEAECGKARVFEGGSSTSLQQTNQTQRIQYGRGSAGGHVAHDQVAVGGQNQQAAFVMVDQLEDWGVSMSSLIGFAPRASAWYQRVIGNWAQPIFGLYLGRNLQASESNPVGGQGVLTLGGVDSSKFSGDLHWIEADLTGWWTIPIDDFKLNDQSLDLTLATGPYSHMNGKPAGVIDSGTTLINGPRTAITDLYNKIGATEISTNLFVFPCSNNLPTLSFTFGGVEYKVHKDDMILGASTVSYIRNRFNVTLPGADGDYYCRAAVDIFEPPNAQFSAPSWIIGSAFMRSVYTAHRVTPPAIGFAAVAEGGPANPASEPTVEQGGNTKVTPEDANSDIASTKSGASATAASAGLLSAALVAAFAAL